MDSSTETEEEDEPEIEEVVSDEGDDKTVLDKSLCRTIAVDGGHRS